MSQLIWVPHYINRNDHFVIVIKCRGLEPTVGF